MKSSIEILEIPERVDHGADRHVHDALLRAEPAQLGVVDKLVPQAAEVCEDRLDVPPEEVALEGGDRGDLDVVASADGEDEGMTLQAVRCVGADAQVRGRIVWVWVHGIRAVEQRRRWKTHVDRLEYHNSGEC